MYRLDVILRAKGMRKADLADKLGISRQSLSSLIKNPSLSNLERIASALEVPIWELFKEESTDLSGKVIRIDGVDYVLTRYVEGHSGIDAERLRDNVTERINELGLTKKKLSEMLGIRARNLNKLLVNPSLDNLTSLANALGCSIDTLYK